MKVSLKKRILAVIACTCAFCFLCQTSVSYADNLDKLKGQSSDLKNELSNINQELLDIGKQIADNEVKMESMEGDIAKTQEQLAIAKNNEKAQYDDMKVRIQYIYENDDETMLGMILSASSLADFVNKIDFVQTLNDYDREMLDELVTLRENIEAEEKRLGEQKESYVKLEKELTEKKEQLKVKAAETSTDLEALNAKISEMKAQQAKEEVEAAASANSNSTNQTSTNNKPTISGGSNSSSGSGNSGSSSSSGSSGGGYKYPSGPGVLTPSKGVNYYNGFRETYYSQKILPGYGLKIPGRHIASDGTIRDGNGYLCLAAHKDDFARYSIVQTSLGPGKVYDTGCAKGTIDIYTDW